MKHKNMGLLSPGTRVSHTLLSALLLLVSFSAKSQTIIGASFADNVLAAGIDARNINCDMTYNWSGGHLRVVAYDDFNTGMGYVRLDDFSGGSLTIPITNGLFPDVVIGDDMNNPGTDYILGLVYGASVTWFETYSITGVGSSTLTATQTSFQQLSVPGNPTSRFPHIDLYPDVNNQINGWNALHEFVITWSEDFGSGMDIYATSGDLMNPTTLSAFLAITSGGSGMMSDVAALFDVSAGQPYAYIPYFNSSTNDLDIAEVDILGNSFTTTSGVDNPLQSLPRIDAMNMYDNSLGMQHYQVAYPKYNGTSYEMWSYNDLTANNDLSSVGFSSFDNIHAAVAAGPGPWYGVPDYGNDNYAVAWHLPGANRYVAQSIDVLTGWISGTFPDYYITNQNPMVTSAPSTYYSNIAVSTSTNVGARLLTSWSGNGRVWYKYNSNTASYKTNGVEEMPRNEQYALYPNPATTMLNIAGAKNATYTITDMMGRTLLTGNIDDKNETIHINRLSAGLYVAAIKEGEVTTLIKFTKQ